MVDFSNLSPTDEAVQKVVNKFKEFGIGIIMTKYISDDKTERHTLWHDLVYGSVIENQTYVMTAKFQDFVERASKGDALKGVKTFKTSKFTDAFALPISDEFGKKVTISWEDLAVFTWAAICKRDEIETLKSEKAEYEKLLEDRKKNRTAEEMRKEMDERLQILAAKFDKKDA